MQIRLAKHIKSPFGFKTKKKKNPLNFGNLNLFINEATEPRSHNKRYSINVLNLKTIYEHKKKKK